MDLSIKSFRYNEGIEQVQVGLAGDLGQGLFQIAIQFPFNAGEPLAADALKPTSTRANSSKNTSSPWTRGAA